VPFRSHAITDTGCSVVGCSFVFCIAVSLGTPTGALFIRLAVYLSTGVVKRVEFRVPVGALYDLGVLSRRFFRNNERLEVLQTFQLRTGVVTHILRVRRRGSWRPIEEVERMRRELVARYDLSDFEILSTDPGRREYVALVEHRVPPSVSRALSELGPGLLPAEPVTITEREAAVSLYVAEPRVGRLRSFLRDLGIPVRVGSVRPARGDAWEPLASLSPRQREILQLAYRLGYYDSPARTSLARIGALAGISKAAVSKHLRAAERKLVMRSLEPTVPARP